MIFVSAILIIMYSKQVRKPYEFIYDGQTYSYYDNPDKFADIFYIANRFNDTGIDKDANRIIINENNEIRSIYITDPAIKTYKGISVGDNVQKVKDTFKNYTPSCTLEDEGCEFPSVWFPTEYNDEQIGIQYKTDENSNIELIIICDFKYQKYLK